MSSESRYEIFKKLPDQQAGWVESAESLEDAKCRLQELTIMFPASYFIVDTETACFIVPQG